MKMYVGGEWIDRDAKIDVVNPYDGKPFESVPKGDLRDVERGLESAVRGARAMAKLPAYERYRILKKAADLVEARIEDFARTITLEEGKTLGESRAEAGRRTGPAGGVPRHTTGGPTQRGEEPCGTRKSSGGRS